VAGFAGKAAFGEPEAGTAEVGEFGGLVDFAVDGDVPMGLIASRHVEVGDGGEEDDLLVGGDGRAEGECVEEVVEGVAEVHGYDIAYGKR
jgi:hypothetical protein